MPRVWRQAGDRLKRAVRRDLCASSSSGSRSTSDIAVGTQSRGGGAGCLAYRAPERRGVPVAYRSRDLLHAHATVLQGLRAHCGRMLPDQRGGAISRCVVYVAGEGCARRSAARRQARHRRYVRQRCLDALGSGASQRIPAGQHGGAARTGPAPCAHAGTLTLSTPSARLRSKTLAQRVEHHVAWANRGARSDNGHPRLADAGPRPRFPARFRPSSGASPQVVVAARPYDATGGLQREHGRARGGHRPPRDPMRGDQADRTLATRRSAGVDAARRHWPPTGRARAGSSACPGSTGQAHGVPR